MKGEDESDRLAESLVKQDLITREELDKVRQREKDSGVPFHRQLIQMGKLSVGVVEDILRTEFHPKSKRDEHKNLGKTLLEMKAINQAQLDDALKSQKRSGRLLGNILLDSGVIDRQTMAKALSKQYGLQYSPLAQTPSEQAALDAVPEHLARKHEFIPVAIEKDRVTVLVNHPQKEEALNHVSIILGKRFHPQISDVDDIKKEIQARYQGKNVQKTRRKTSAKAASAPQDQKHTQPDSTTKGKTSKTKPSSSKKKSSTKENTTVADDKLAIEARDRTRFDEIARQASGVPVVQLVTTIIEGAVNSGATDIHLDPQDPEMRVRYRIDGILHDVMSIPNETEAAVVSRVKIMADMDITETRHPQDGHISMEVSGDEFDIRVATLPTFLGERVVLRVLDQTSVLAGIKDLGLEEKDQERLKKLVAQPYGMLLVTGPTGSGKTTTLYAALNQKDVMTESIVTLEDPVEYQLSGINQVQIDLDINMTFANTLRAAMRQDIDVLLVGEIRDPETARIATRAAMTGHLVLSTLHTNDAPEAISTLRNMEIPPFLIESALTAVLGQRLIRKICDDCKKSFKPSQTLLKSIGLPATIKKLHRGEGCQVCYGTGNKGRTGIFEILEITPKVREMIAEERPPNEIAKTVKLRTMADHCRQKVREGIVEPEEFLRVIRT